MTMRLTARASFTLLTSPLFRFACAAVPCAAMGIILVVAPHLRAQAPGVPIVRETHGAPPQLIYQARKLHRAGKLLHMDEVKTQLAGESCRLALPRPRQRSLTGNQLWNLARKAHIRVGYFYLCTRCTHWHLKLAGGYAITADGAVATCYHVVEPRDMKEGYLVATTAEGKVLPVTRVLAGSKSTDACIVRVYSETPLEPLPLNTDVAPGDAVWCYSDPADRSAYFSDGIVNRFYQHWHGAGAKDKYPVRMNVSTDWAPGSSGAAVIDRFGNAVGHVTTVSPHAATSQPGTTTRPALGTETIIVFHDAVCAADVIALVKR